MHPVAAILDSLVIYRYSLVLALSGAAAVCFFLGCCSFARVSSLRASAAALTAAVLSLPLSRLIYWYGRPDSFASLAQALTSPATESYALAGVLAACTLSALLTGGLSRKGMLDCMSVAGCFGLALGRLGSFFTESSRGQVMRQYTRLPWSYPVVNASGQLEYRFATFLLQAVSAAILGTFLAALFFRKKEKPGEITIRFILVYSASQVILDSTRYDSLYLRGNGFVSIVQIFSAAALVLVLVALCVRTLKVRGFQRWMIPLWISLTALSGMAGYMEYYVQRHGREAAFAYSIMGSCLACLVGLGLLLRHLSLPGERNERV